MAALLPLQQGWMLFSLSGVRAKTSLFSSARDGAALFQGSTGVSCESLAGSAIRHCQDRTDSARHERILIGRYDVRGGERGTYRIVCSRYVPADNLEWKGLPQNGWVKRRIGLFRKRFLGLFPCMKSGTGIFRERFLAGMALKQAG